MKTTFTYLRFLSALFILISATLNTSAQLGVNVVVDSVHTGSCYDPTCGDIDLTGFTTYDIYAQIPEGGCLTGIFGDLNDMTPNSEDSISMEFTFDGLVFNHWLPAGMFGTNNLCDLEGFDCMEFDSYLSMCQDCSSDGGNIFALTTEPDGPDPFSIFINELGCGGLFENGSLTIDQGGWFAPPGTIPCATAGADEQILIAQITTNGNFCMHFYVAYQPGCIPGTELEIYEVNTCVGEPCFANQLDATLEANSPLCEGNISSMQLLNSGNGTVEYQLHDGSNGIFPNNPTIATYLSDTGLNMDDIPSGCYYFTMTDSLDCPDTTTIACIADVPEFLFDATLLTDNLCYGDELGSINTQCTGGAGEVLVTLDGPAFMYDGSQTCGATFTALGCVGNDAVYLLTAQDENGCVLSETINLYCAEELMVAVTNSHEGCAGECSGMLTATLSGGTGTADVMWLLNGNVLESFEQVNTPLELTVDSLCAGMYSITCADENECQAEVLHALAAPDILTAEMMVVNAINGNNGALAVDAAGGTLPYEYLWSNGDTTAANTGLGQGLYSCIITDANGCTLELEASIIDLGLTEQHHQNLMVLPNPATTNITLVPAAGIERVAVNDANGKVWLNTAILNGNATLNISALPAGNYTVAVYYRDGRSGSALWVKE